MNARRVLPFESRRQFLVAAVTSFAATLLPTPFPVHAAPADPVGVGADWKGVLGVMFPHPGLDPALYDVTVGALQAAAAQDAKVRQLLDDGWARLLTECGGDWSAAGDEARVRALRAIQDTPVFRLLRQTTVFTFYANPKVWEAFGYEGDAWKFGGYAGSGLRSLDWLPNPPSIPAGK